MSKTEIEIYVHPTFVRAFENNDVHDIPTFRNKEGRHAKDYVKAKLIVDLEPEKKIELTESKFDEYIKALEGDLCMVNHKQLKQKLFGEKS